MLPCFVKKNISNAETGKIMAGFLIWNKHLAMFILYKNAYYLAGLKSQISMHNVRMYS